MKILAVVAIVLAVGMTGLLSLFPIRSFDIWWHLRTGQLILEQFSIPRTDPFTYTAAGQPWVTHEWLSEVLFFGLYRLGGVNLLVIWKAFLATLAIALAAVAALVGSNIWERLPATALGSILAAPLMALRAFVRPHMMTAVLLGATLVFLRCESDSDRPRWRWALVPLFLLWANLHSGFVFGLLLVVLYWTGEFIGRRVTGQPSGSTVLWRRRGITLGAILVVTLVNPHHVEAFLYPLRLMFRGEVRETIAELQSVFHPSYRSAFFRWALGASILTLVFLLIGSKGRVRFSLLLPFLFFGFLATTSIRGLSELAVMIPTVIGVHGRLLGRRVAIAAATSLVVIVLAIGGAVATLGHGIPMGEEGIRRVGLGVDPVNCPQGAVQFLKRERPQGNMFNIMAFGGYLIHELWPERKVYIDGRLDVFSPGFLNRYQRMLDTGEGWATEVERYDIAIAVIDYGENTILQKGLRARLREDPGWICVYFGDNALVYLRQNSENSDILHRYACPFDPSLRSLSSLDDFADNAKPQELEQTIAALEKIVEISPGEPTSMLVLGRLLDRLGMSTRGATWLQRAVELSPSSVHARLMWAEALWRAGAQDESRRELGVVLQEMPNNVPALLLLADQEREVGRLEEAVRALEKASLIETNNFFVQLRLGVLSAQQGEIEKAKRYFHLAGRIRPQDPAVQKNLERLRLIEEHHSDK